MLSEQSFQEMITTTLSLDSICGGRGLTVISKADSVALQVESSKVSGVRGLVLRDQSRDDQQTILVSTIL